MTEREEEGGKGGRGCDSDDVPLEAGLKWLIESLTGEGVGMVRNAAFEGGLTLVMMVLSRPRRAEALSTECRQTRALSGEATVQPMLSTFRAYLFRELGSPSGHPLRPRMRADPYDKFCYRSPPSLIAKIFRLHIRLEVDMI